MRRLLALTAALAIGLAGCDPTGNDFDPIEDMRLVIVAGDGQVEPVPEPGSALLESEAVAPTFVDPLVAELRDAAGNRANPEPGTQVSFVSDAPETCWPFTLSDVPDDSAHVSTRAEKGTKAGACHIEARRVLADGTAHIDTVWALTVEPGPVVDAEVGQWGSRAADGLVHLWPSPFEDAYGNEVAFYTESEDWLRDTTVVPMNDPPYPALALTRTDLTEGDTTAVRFYLASDSTLIADTYAELTYWPGNGDWIVRFHRRP